MCACVDPDKQRELIDHHFYTIRMHPVYGRCHHRVYIEANMAPSHAIDVANQLRHERYGPLDIVHGIASDPTKPGIITTHDRKESYAEELVRAVPAMQFASDFLCLDPDSVCKEFFQQLCDFRKEVVDTGASATHVSTALFNKVVITGKAAGKKDDLTMAFCIALFYMYRSIFRDDAFQRYCLDNGMCAG